MRLARLVLLACAVALLVPMAALAAPKMWVGFQDDSRLRYSSDREYMLERAKNSNSTIVTASLDWGTIAPRRPRRATNPFDAAYRFENIDEFVRGAQRRGLEPMLRLIGTPRWAGPARNRMPRRLADLTAFARAVATRYSGRYPGYPFVRFYAVWNEPNLNQFFSPQFDKKGRSVAPRNYVRLFTAAYTGLKQGNRQSVVAVGETSARGRDRRRRGLQDTHSPGKFMELVAKANPRLRFDAVSHHPYPTDSRQRPEQVVRWPNVSLASMPRYQASLRKWFKRKTPIRMWITEYGHETVPDPNGIAYATQADYLRRALNRARRMSYVDMFIWFVLQDDQGNPWQSGLIDEDGTPKPAFTTWASMVYDLDPRNSIIRVKGGRANPVVRISALEIASESPVGARVGVDLRVIQGDSLIAHPQPEARLGRDGWVSVPVAFRPQVGRVYHILVEVNDIHGNRVKRLLTLVGIR
jgi:hypothetical protein